MKTNSILIMKTRFIGMILDDLTKENSLNNRLELSSKIKHQLEQIRNNEYNRVKDINNQTIENNLNRIHDELIAIFDKTIKSSFIVSHKERMKLIDIHNMIKNSLKWF